MTYKLTREAKTLFENESLEEITLKLHRMQGNSIHRALQTEGYKIFKGETDISDRFIIKSLSWYKK